MLCGIFGWWNSKIITWGQGRSHDQWFVCQQYANSYYIYRMQYYSSHVCVCVCVWHTLLTPSLSTGPGTYSVLCGPTLQYRPRLAPLMMTMPLPQPFMSRNVSHGRPWIVNVPLKRAGPGCVGEGVRSHMPPESMLCVGVCAWVRVWGCGQWRGTHTMWLCVCVCTSQCTLTWTPVHVFSISSVPSHRRPPVQSDLLPW